MTYIPRQDDGPAAMERAKDALGYIDASDRDTWWRMAMALKSEFGEDGFSVWDDWSQTAGNYNQPDAMTVWRGIKSGGGVGIGSLFHEAKENGWRDDVTYTAETMTPEQVEERRQARLKKTAEAEEQVRHEQAQAARWTAEIWQRAEPVAVNPYLERKQVSPTSTLRQIDVSAINEIIGYPLKSKGEPLTGVVLVAPMRRAGSSGLCSTEFIDGTGRKTALAGRGTKSGAYWATERLDDPAVLLVGEGVATVMSVSQAVNLPGVAALSCGNMKPVALAMREMHPAAKIILLADLKKDTGEPDPKAMEAAQVCRGLLAVPNFGPGWTAAAGTDFNDLAIACGIGAVKVCIEAAVELVQPPGESDWNRDAGQTAGKNAAKEAHARECLAGIFNGADLLEMDLPEVHWAVPELLPQGLAILAGGPKLGKSWLIYSICLGMGAGCRVLDNFQTPQAKSLYLALEDGKRRLQDRLKALCKNEPAVKAGLGNVDFQINWPRFDDEGGLEKLEAYIEEKVPEGLKLVVIDTLAKVGPKAKSKGLNAYENDSIIMTRIKSMADKHGICILIVTHLSKLRTSKDPFDSITGSMGQFGTADTAMLLTRKRGAASAILQTTGRDIEGHSYDLAWSNPGWSCQGFANEDEVDLSPERLAILQVFKDHGQPVSSGMVAAETGKTVSSTSKLIKKLVEEGFLFSCGYGLYSVQSVQSGKTVQSGQSGQSSDCPSLNTFPTFPSGLIPNEVTI